MFLFESTMTSLRPDLVLWSSSLCTVYIIELTAPWDDAVKEAYECKNLMFAEPEGDAKQCGWKPKVCPVEDSCRGFIGKSTTSLLKDLGIREQAQQQAMKALSTAAEKAYSGLRKRITTGQKNIR